MQILDQIVAFFIAALSGMGIGSGGLLVLYLTFFRSVPQLSAQGQNLLFFIFASAASMSIHLSRRKMYPIPLLLMIIVGLLGATLGSKVALHLPEEWTRRLFGIFLIIAGLSSLFSILQKKREEKAGKKAKKNL